MKRICLMVLMVIFINHPLFAQKKDLKESEVPEVVKKSYLAKYPNGKSRYWKVKNGEYEVDFYIDHIKYEAKFESDGGWKKTSFDITRKQIPEKVTVSWKAGEFSGWLLGDQEQVETTEHPILYLITVSKGLKEMELTYSPTGDLLKAKEKSKSN